MQTATQETPTSLVTPDGAATRADTHAQRTANAHPYGDANPNSQSYANFDPDSQPNAHPGPSGLAGNPPPSAKFGDHPGKRPAGIGVGRMA